MQSQYLRLISSLVFLILNACAHRLSSPAATCTTQVRALLDVGSGATKVNVSEVEICSGKARVVRVLEDKLEIPLALEAGKDHKGRLTPAVQDQAFKVLKEIRAAVFATVRKFAPEVSTIDFVAVGTHALRTATNSAEFAGRVQSLGFTLIPLTQQQEGEFAFQGVELQNPPAACQKRQLVVWDMGGGSQQISQRETRDRLLVLGIGFSSEVFRQHLIRETGARGASRKCTGGSATPNPIGEKNFDRALRLSRGLAKKALRGFHFDAKTQCLVGVGGVHTKSIESKIHKLWPELQACVCGQEACAPATGAYSRKELSCLAKFLSRKSDCDPELSGPFSAVTASNAFLTLGFLDELQAEEVQTRSVNMGNLLITDFSRLPWLQLKVPPEAP